MYQGGRLDFGITPAVARPGGACDQTPSPKYFVELRGAGHFAWANPSPAHHDQIADHAVAFFDHTLRHEKAELLRRRMPGRLQTSVPAIGFSAAPSTGCRGRRLATARHR